MKLSLFLCLFFILVMLAPAMHAQDTSGCYSIGQSVSPDCPGYNLCYQCQQNYNTAWAFCAGQGFYCYVAAWWDFQTCWSQGCGSCFGCIGKNNFTQPIDRGKYYVFQKPVHVRVAFPALILYSR